MGQERILDMKQERIMHSRAIWLLLAAAALPSTPLLAQNQAPIVEPPPPVVTIPPVILDPAPMPTPAPQPPVTRTTPPAATAPPPAAAAPGTPERRATARTTRTRTVATRTRAQAPVRRVAPAAATAPAAAAPAPAAAPAAPAAETAALPPAVTPAPLPVPQEPASSIAGVPIWTWAVGAALLLLAAFALFNMRRHRNRAEEVDEVYYDEPIAAAPMRETIVEEPAPMSVAPAAAAGGAFAARELGNRSEILSTPMGDVVAPAEFEPAAEESLAMPEQVAVAEPDPADVEALAATSAAPDGRPWLEFLMRPVRAGTSKDGAIVEFELTVGNTGTVTARDVRISTFMFAAGSAGESEMERMLIDPPADAALEEVTIKAGEATRIEARMELPREGLADESVLPVVVADARYRLPDGTEGRTRASFEVGIPSGDGIGPFKTDRVSGLLESVEARLHDEPERV
jgi:hypothetical protein